MRVLKPRTKVVYFRVSEEEFIRLNELCRVHGVRSLSDLVREAMGQMMRGNSQPNDSAVAQAVASLNRNILELDRTLKKALPLLNDEYKLPLAEDET